MLVLLVDTNVGSNQFRAGTLFDETNPERASEIATITAGGGSFVDASALDPAFIALLQRERLRGAQQLIQSRLISRLASNEGGENPLVPSGGDDAPIIQAAIERAALEGHGVVALSSRGGFKLGSQIRPMNHTRLVCLDGGNAKLWPTYTGVGADDRANAPVRIAGTLTGYTRYLAAPIGIGASSFSVTVAIGSEKAGKWFRAHGIHPDTNVGQAITTEPFQVAEDYVGGLTTIPIEGLFKEKHAGCTMLDSPTDVDFVSTGVGTGTIARNTGDFRRDRFFPGQLLTVGGTALNNGTTLIVVAVAEFLLTVAGTVVNESNVNNPTISGAMLLEEIVPVDDVTLEHITIDCTGNNSIAVGISIEDSVRVTLRGVAGKNLSRSVVAHYGVNWCNTENVTDYGGCNSIIIDETIHDCTTTGIWKFAGERFHVNGIPRPAINLRAMSSGNAYSCGSMRVLNSCLNFAGGRNNRFSDLEFDDIDPTTRLARDVTLEGGYCGLVFDIIAGVIAPGEWHKEDSYSTVLSNIQARGIKQGGIYPANFSMAMFFQDCHHLLAQNITLVNDGFTAADGFTAFVVSDSTVHVDGFSVRGCDTFLRTKDTTEIVHFSNGRVQQREDSIRPAIFFEHEVEAHQVTGPTFSNVDFYEVGVNWVSFPPSWEIDHQIRFTNCRWRGRPFSDVRAMAAGAGVTTSFFCKLGAIVTLATSQAEADAVGMSAVTNGVALIDTGSITSVYVPGASMSGAPNDVDFTVTTITRNSGNFITDLFTTGMFIKIVKPGSLNHNRTVGPLTAISATVLTIASGGLVAESNVNAPTITGHEPIGGLVTANASGHAVKASARMYGVPTFVVESTDLIDGLEVAIVRREEGGVPTPQFGQDGALALPILASDPSGTPAVGTFFVYGKGLDAFAKFSDTSVKKLTP